MDPYALHSPELHAPPRAWFEPPEDRTAGERLTIDADGRVHGYFALWGDELVRDDGSTFVPPRDPASLERFHAGHVVTAEGELLRVGVLGAVGHPDYSPHAGGLPDAGTHYRDIEYQRAVVRAHVDDVGLLVAGAILPATTHAQVAQLRRLSLSGDWRPVRARRGSAGTWTHELVGLALTSAPGLAVGPSRVARLADAAHDAAEAIAAPKPALLPTHGTEDLDLAQRLHDGATEEQSARLLDVVNDVRAWAQSARLAGSTVEIPDHPAWARMAAELDRYGLDIGTVALGIIQDRQLAELAELLDQAEAPAVAAMLAVLDRAMPVPLPV